MSCDFVDAPATPGVAPDPTKHVNYTLGMVLGADDFGQEFAYHAERDRWAARDLCGYGTLWGLRVGVERGAEVVVNVAPGAALTPRGHLVRVAPAQCASLDAWLRNHAAEPRLQAPPGQRLRLWVSLGYRACLSDERPVPGEPCRGETDMLKPSRVTDWFELKLDLDPPVQQEEAEVRAFVRWLGDHVVTDDQASLSITPAQFADAVVAGFAPEEPGGSGGLPGGGDWSEPLVVPAAEHGDYLRAAFEAWTTRIRPRRRPDFLGSVHACSGTTSPQENPDGDRILLAALDLVLDRKPGDTAWGIQGKPEVLTEDRPILLASRLLQEWVLCGGIASGGAGGPGIALAPRLLRSVAPAMPPVAPPATPPAAPAAGYVVVAAGHVTPAEPTPTLGGLRVAKVLGDGALLLTFDGLVVPRPKGTQYVVKALPAPAEEPARAKESLTVSFGGYRNAARGAPDGFVLRIRDGGVLLPRARLEGLGLQVEVCRFESGW